jgi:hypothetical protein
MAGKGTFVGYGAKPSPWISLADVLAEQIQQTYVPSNRSGRYTTPQTESSGNRLQHLRDDAQDKGLVGTYTNVMLTNPEISSVCHVVATELVSVIRQRFIDRYGNKLSPLQVAMICTDARSVAEKVITSVLTLGFCVLLLQDNDESDADNASIAVDTSLGQETVDTEGPPSSESHTHKDAKHVPPDSARMITIQPHGNVFQVNKDAVPWGHQKTGDTPRFEVANEFASCIYAAKHTSKLCISDRKIKAEYGIENAHTRITVVGFEGIGSKPKASDVFLQALQLSMAPHMINQRLDMGTRPTVIQTQKNMQELSAMIVPDRGPLLDALEDITREGMSAIDRTVSGMVESMHNRKVARLGNVDLVPYNAVVIPPEYAATSMPSAMIDPLMPTIIDNARKIIQDHIGGTPNSTSSRFRDSSTLTQERLMAQAQKKAWMNMVGLTGLARIYGLKVGQEDIDRLSAEGMIEQLTYLTIHASMAGKVQDGNKGVRFEDVMSQVEKPQSSVAKRRKGADDESSGHDDKDTDQKGKE